MHRPRCTSSQEEELMEAPKDLRSDVERNGFAIVGPVLPKAIMDQMLTF